MNQLKTFAFVVLLALPLAGLAAEAPATLYKNPNCGCCDEYADYLEQNGFEVEVIDTYDLVQMKEQHKVSENMYGCHTMLVGPYVFEGLIPMESVRKVLDERPFIKGLSLPGMPMGAPGMPGPKDGPLEVYTLGFGASASAEIYATY